MSATGGLGAVPESITVSGLNLALGLDGFELRLYRFCDARG